MNSILTYLLALGLGPGLLGFGLWQLYRETRLKRWQRVKAIIIQSRIERQLAGRGGYQYVAIIEFEFSHENSLIRIMADLYITGTRDSAESKVSKYPPGSTALIFVNPKDPTSACLEKQITPKSWLFIALGLLASTVAACSYFFS